MNSTVEQWRHRSNTKSSVDSVRLRDDRIRARDDTTRRSRSATGPKHQVYDISIAILSLCNLHVIAEQSTRRRRSCVRRSGTQETGNSAQKIVLESTVEKLSASRFDESVI